MTKQEFFIPHKGEELHCIEWKPEGEAVAVLQIVHGMVEYVDRYCDFAKFLCAQNIAVVGHDHPGHGKTARSADDLGYIQRKGGSEHLCDCAHRVTEHIKEKYPAVPVFIMGHSMGSFVVRRYITSYGKDVCGAIVMGTGTPPGAVLSAGRVLASVIAKLKGERHRSKFLENISFSGYNSRFPKGEGPHAWISSDGSVVNKYEKDPFCTYTFTASGFGVLYDTLAFLSAKRDFENIPKELPILVTAGADDPVGSYGKGPRDFAELCKKRGIGDVTLTLYDGDRHEIINEKDKEQVYADIFDWIAARIK